LRTEELFHILHSRKLTFDGIFEPEPAVRPTKLIYQADKEGEGQFVLSDQKQKSKQLKIANIQRAFSQ
jgi:hypothetical protein